MQFYLIIKSDGQVFAKINEAKNADANGLYQGEAGIQIASAHCLHEEVYHYPEEFFSNYYNYK